MNEWKSCFFFSGVVFFFSAPEIEWMNDMWTFPGKKNTHKKKHRFWKKKKTVSYAQKKSHISKGYYKGERENYFPNQSTVFLYIYTYKKHPLFFSSFWRFGGRFFSKPCFNLFSPSFYLFCWNLFCLSPTANHVFSELLKVFFTLIICHICWVLFIQIKVVI